MKALLLAAAAFTAVVAAPGSLPWVDGARLQVLDTGTDTGLRRVRPLVIAHRGCSDVAPENTLAAIRVATEHGVHIVECDVRITADRVPVLLHDEELARTTGAAGAVGEWRLADLKRLDAGSWFSPAFAGEKIPTLREALKLAKGEIRLVMDIKQPGIEAEVLRSIRRSGIAPEDLAIFSDDEATARAYKTAEPRLPVVWLVKSPVDQDTDRRTIVRRAKNLGADAIGLPQENVNASIIRRAHRAGLGVFVWTVNDPDRMRQLVRMKVDGIITDRAGLCRKVVRR